MHMPLIHPGEILLEEYMNPMGLSSIQVAKGCNVPRTRIERIVKKQSSITADTALRLGKFLGVSPELWIHLQADYDLELAQKHTKLGKIKPYKALAAAE
jgi:addiction module HigA family antidote